MSNKPKKFATDEELFEYLDRSGLGDRLRKGDKEAFKEYFELGGAKVAWIEDRQPTKN